jgi:hypothetical protein
MSNPVKKRIDNKRLMAYDWRVPRILSQDLTIVFQLRDKQVELVPLSSGALFPVRSWALVGDMKSGLFAQLTLGVEEGEVVLDRFEVDRQAGQPGLSSQLLRDLSAKSVMNRVITDGVIWAGTLGAHHERVVRKERGRYLTPGEHANLRQLADRTTAARRIRRTITPELLKDVARIATENRGAPTEAVHTQMHTSHRNATRWIALARKDGYLDNQSRNNCEEGSDDEARQ